MCHKYVIHACEYIIEMKGKYQDQMNRNYKQIKNKDVLIVCEKLKQLKI